MKSKRYFYLALHLLFLSGLLYAFNHFITTPKIDYLQRRLWAYENWIIFSFYALFLYLTLTERQIRLTARKNKSLTRYLNEFRRILAVNLLLLAFPWGLILLLAPQDLLSLLHFSSIYWRILGAGSLIGAIIYYFPYRFYHHPFSRYIFIFGAIDNLIAGLALTGLFVLEQIPLTAWSTTPLLFYFAYFFYDQAKKHPQITTKKS